VELFTNFSKSLLAAGISSGSATVTVSAGTGALFPAPTGSDYARLVIFEIGSSGETNQEIVLLTARGGDTLTITRAQEGTTARAFSAGAYIALRPTASTLTDMRPNSLHVKKTVLFESEYDAGNSGAAVSIDFTNGQKQKLTLTANATVTLTAPASDRVGHFQLRIVQDGTGGRTLAFSGIAATSWLNSPSQPEHNTAASGETIVSLFWTGAKFIGSLNQVGV